MAKSGQVPEGYARLTANVPIELHTKLKIAAALKRTTVGELISNYIKHELEVLLRME